MSNRQSKLRHRRIWRPDVALGITIVGVMFASILAPRAGSAVLLMPMTDQSAQSALQWALTHDARVLGSSMIGGIVLDHAPDQIFVHALMSGALAISVPASACSSRPRSKR